MPRNTFSVGMLRGATPGLSRLAQQIGGGDTSYQQGYANELGLQSKLGMQLAQMRNEDASARAHDATAQQTGAETAILTDRPNQFREQVANFAGSDGPTVDAYRQKLRTGAAPQVPMGPPAEDGTMGVGSQQFDPALQSKLAQAIKQFAPMLFNQKDMKPDDLAQADATYNKTGLLNSAVAGAIDRNRLGGAVAATEGKPLFHVSGDGGVLDQYTGNLNEQGGLAQSTIGLKKAQTGAQDASAKNSIAGAAAHYASADNSRASAARPRLDIEQGVRTGQIQVITDNDGNVSLLNKATGVSRPATSADGVPLKGKSVADKPLPEGAQKQLIGTRNLQDAIGEYKTMLTTWSSTDMLSPDKRAKMGRAYNNMMLQAKEAYNLGVLNGPDYDILQSVVKDPTKLTSLAVSNDALNEQASALGNTAANIERTVLESHGKKYTPRAPAPDAPATPKARTVVRTGTANGRKVVQYSDGTTDYAD